VDVAIRARHEAYAAPPERLRDDVHSIQADLTRCGGAGEARGERIGNPGEP
jgi:hypothetical protein